MLNVDDTDTYRANLDYIRSSMREPLLDRDDELALARRWRETGDVRALHRLVRPYTRLVISTARRFRHYGLPVGDLVQEGNVGLMQAASRFEPEREVRFSTYATWWIRSALQDYILRNWSIVRTGTTSAHKSLFFNLRRLRRRIEEETAQALDDAGRRRIADHLQVNIGDVTQMEQRLAGGDYSLNAPLTDGGDQNWQESLPDERPSPEDCVIGLRDSKQRIRWLAEALQALNPREREIIAERRLRDNGATLAELGQEMGISKERVRQLEQRAFNKLRRHLHERVEQVGDLF